MNLQTGKWGTVLAPTDINDPQTGEQLYVLAKVRPAWFWAIKRWQLFFAIVWREWEPGYRISIKTAMSVANGVHPK